MARKKSSYNHPLQGSLFNDPFSDLPVFEPIADFALHFNEKREQSDGYVPESDMDCCKREELPDAPALLLLSFGSGSSGNCTYVGTRREGVLVDAGVDGDTVKQGLLDNGLSIKNVKGIILTHDHSDHVRFAYTIVRKNPQMGIYCTPKALGGLLRRHSISRRIKDYHHPVFKEFSFEVAGLKITPFDTPHDGTDNCGFFIQLGDINFCVATDLGCVTPRVEYYMRQSRYVMLESNYDPEMLRTGPYPMHLKARIEFDNGHLSNSQCGSFLASLAGGGMKIAFLCHLSQDNNTPELALSTVCSHLAEAGFTQVGSATGAGDDLQKPVHVVALPRFDVSPLYVMK